jgi:hypothetical protein
VFRSCSRISSASLSAINAIDLVVLAAQERRLGSRGIARGRHFG